jgi:uncharacterized membrane protein
MEHLEHSLIVWAGALKLFLEVISLFCIFLGLLTTGHVIVRQNRRSRTSPDSLGRIRLNFGRWLSLALEFQLGADIVNTTVAPSSDALIRLGAIALIRTFLNYFLSKELAEEITASEQSSQPLSELAKEQT